MSDYSETRQFYPGTSVTLGDRYKRRFQSAVEGVFVDETKEESLFDSLRRLSETGVGKFERTKAALRIARRYTPNFIRRKIQDKLVYSQDKMPFNPKDYKLKHKMGFGGVNDVFFLEAQKKKFPSYVLKVSRHISANPELDELTFVAKEQKEEYERIASLYSDVPDLVPEEYYTIGHGPRKSERTVMMMQVFVANNIRDIFDIEEEELIGIVRNNDELKEQLKRFVSATLENNDELIENEIDLLGKDNLVIVEADGGERLLMLDPHFISKKSRSPQRRDDIEERIYYLQKVVDTTK